MKNLNQNTPAYKAVLLAILCSVCGLLLSAVNAVTKPIIEENAVAAVKSTLEKIYPGASFKDLSSEYVPDETGLVDGVYEAEGKGYIFTLHNIGYGGEYTFLIGYNNDGTVAGYAGLENSETPGKGSLAWDTDYTNQVMGLTSSDPLPLISGATITTQGVSQAADAARAIFNSIQGIEYDPDAKPAAPEKEEQKPLGEEDLSSAKAAAKEVSNDGKTAVYECTADGFTPGNGAKITVDLAAGKITAFEITKFADDKDGVGDDAADADKLERYVGITAADTPENYTGATMTSKAFRAMAQAALNAAAGKEAAPAPSGSSSSSADYSKYKAACIYNTNTDPKALVFDCSADGFGMINYGGNGYARNEVRVTVNGEEGKVVSVEALTFGDTKDIGDAAFTEDVLKKYAGLSEASAADTVTGATFTSNSVKAMVQAALDMAAGK